MDKTTTDSAQLHAFVRNLDDVEWQAVQDRMVDPVSPGPSACLSPLHHRLKTPITFLC